MKKMRKMFGMAVLVLLVGIGVKTNWAEAGEVKNLPLNEEFETEYYTEYSFSISEPSKLVIKSNGDWKISGSDGDSWDCYRYEGTVIRVPAGEYTLSPYYGQRKFLITATSESASMYEQEHNNSFDTANEISTDISYTGNNDKYNSYSDYSDKDYFHFTLDQSGSITIDKSNCDYELYKEDTATHNTTEISSAGKYRLPAGSYFARVIGDRNGNDYTFKVNYSVEADGNYESEPNNSQDSANAIGLDTAYTGNIENSGDVDYYRANVTESGELTLYTEILRQSQSSFTFQLYSTDGKLLDTVNSTSNPTAIGKAVMVQPGDYFVKVTSRSSNSEDYKITLKFAQKTLASSIEVTSSKTSYVKGDTAKLTAAVLPENATNKEVTWSSNDTSVVKVDATGNITCVGSGKAYVTATAKDGSNVKKEILITVEKALPANSNANNKPGNNQTPSGNKDTDDQDWEDEFWDDEDWDDEDWDDEDWEESDDCTLRRIKRTKGTWDQSFDPEVTKYVLTLSARTSKTTIVPVTYDENATFRIEGKKWEGVDVKLKRRQKTVVSIKVTAENGDTMTYKVLVRRR